MKDYGSETPESSFKQDVAATIATLIIAAVVILMTIMALPNFADSQMEAGRELAAISQGVAE